MANLQNFINQYNGKLVPSCGGYSSQCVSLSQAWASANGVQGCPIFPVPAAKDMVGIRGDVFNWIANSPTGVPQSGDIMVWNTAVGVYGHTAVFVNGNASSFTSFDINWPTGSLAHLQSHNYNGVVGWLRLKGGQPQTGDGMGVPNAEYDRVVNDNYLKGVEINNLKNDVKGLTAERNSIKAQADAQFKQFNDRINEQQNALNKATELITKLQEGDGETSVALNKKIAELQKQIEALQDSTPTTLDSYSLGELLSAAFKKTFKIK